MTSPPQAPLPWRFLATTAQLTFLGLAGSIGIGLLVGYAATALALVPLAGLGLILLVGLVYLLYAIGWWETGRVAGLYRLPVPLPRFARSATPTFGGWVRALGRQLGSSRMWRALASAFMAVILGLIQFTALTAVLWAAAMIVARAAGVGRGVVPAAFMGSWGWAGLVLIGLLGAAMCVAMVAVHRTLTVALIRGRAREEELAAEARVSQDQRAGAVRAAEVERTRIERDL